MVDALDGLAALGAGGIEAAVGFESDAEVTGLGVGAFGGDGFDEGLIGLGVGGAAEEEFRGTAGGAEVDELVELLSGGCEVWGGLEVAVDRADGEVALFGFGADLGGLGGGQFRVDDGVGGAFGGHEADPLEAGLGDAIEGAVEVPLVPWAGVATDEVTVGGSLRGGEGGESSQDG